MNLWELNAGARCRIAAIGAELPEEFRIRLSELGFEVGEEVECLRRTPFGGPKVYRVGGSVFSLASDVASYVNVGEIA